MHQSNPLCQLFRSGLEFSTYPYEKLNIFLPELALIVGTRAILGAGIAILLTEDMEKEQRRLLGWTLAAIGAVTTVPLALELYAENRSHRKISRLEARDPEI